MTRSGILKLFSGIGVVSGAVEKLFQKVVGSEQLFFFVARHYYLTGRPNRLFFDHGVGGSGGPGGPPGGVPGGVRGGRGCPGRRSGTGGLPGTPGGPPRGVPGGSPGGVPGGVLGGVKIDPKSRCQNFDTHLLKF
jgi:hypothetical protein